MSRTDQYDPVSAPKHYLDGREYEPADVFSARHMGFDTGNAAKYLSRAGRKLSSSQDQRAKELQDLRKALWYIKFARDAAVRENDGNLLAATDAAVLADWKLPERIGRVMLKLFQAARDVQDQNFQSAVNSLDGAQEDLEQHIRELEQDVTTQ